MTDTADTAAAADAAAAGSSAIPDGLLSLYSRPDAPGAAVAVFRRDGSVAVECLGAARLPERRGADRGSGPDPGPDPVPVEPHTAFRLASITKQLTARAVAGLVEEGALSLATPVGDVVPGLPAWGGAVRIGHLVAHTSGLPEYEVMVPPARTEPLTDRDVVALLATAPALAFPPGSRFDYSNGGYALLATVVEEATGRSFSDELGARIFDPLGMAAVAHVEGVTVVPRRAYGYRAAGGPGERGFVDADQGVTTAVLGDGGVYASALDLARWDAALYEPGWQPDPERLAPFAAPVEPGVSYGFGWYLDEFRGHARQRHDGWSTGFQNEIQRFPEAGLTVLVLTNRATPAVRALAEAMASRLLPAP